MEGEEKTRSAKGRKGTQAKMRVKLNAPYFNVNVLIET